MKKLDKLILKSFLGPFVLTFFVVVFILLIQYMLKYLDEFVGKDLGFSVFAELIMYFSINMTPMALPLAVLLSSLMTFGNLGEHFELTAIKSAGISLTRILLPLFVFVSVLSVLAFFSNNFIVPKANLKAYSLLYDIKQTKPSLSLKEGAFYNGIPNYSIKVNEKYPDGVTLGGLIIYDHTEGRGNTKVILADSGKMYSIHNDNYLMLELFNGNSYNELATKGTRIRGNIIEDYYRNSFDESKIVFSLASFGLKETKEELFASNRLMKNASQLSNDIDSMQQSLQYVQYELYRNINRYFSFHLKNEIQIPENLIPRNSVKPAGEKRIEVIENPKIKNTEKNEDIRKAPTKKDATVESDTSKESLNTSSMEQEPALKVAKEQTKASFDSLMWSRYDSLFQLPTNKQRALSQALSQSRYIKNNVSMEATKAKRLEKEINTYIIEKNKKFSQALACLIMFLIGAPLGAIIKKGGLGIPVIISISFFIISYVLSITGEKWGKEGILDPILATWIANIVLLPFGIFFLKQARNDVRVFESDFYKVLFDKFKTRFKKLRPSQSFVSR